ncbi:unnamed protein product [Victoria cruziana]
MQSWADAEWFTTRPKVAEKITVTVFKVPGETNTDDLSPAPDAWSRPDIPMHYLAMLKNTRPDAAFKPEEDGKRGPMQFIEDLKKKGNLVAYVGDVVGTGSSRKSATNSVIWATGEDIPFVPNKRFGGVTLGGKIAPIFFNTQEDSGSLPIEVDVSNFEMGDVIDIYPYAGKIEKNGAEAAKFELKSQVLLDEVQAGGRINLIIGRSLTGKAREFLGLPASTAFRLPVAPKDTGKGFTLAQKMVGRAVGLPEGQGVRPGTYCEPKMTTDLACLGFSADLVMQSFCHTAAYPKPVDVKMHRELPAFISNRGGGKMQPGVTLRDLVHAIPLYAIKAGLPDLKVEQAFELSDASAERSAAGCTIKLNKEPVAEYLKSNIVLMKNMIANGYADARTLQRRIDAQEAWLANPNLLEADKDAEYAAVIEIDLADIKEPIVCCPNDPDDAKFLSEVAGTKIDEAFIGSCMTNIGHFRAAGKVLEGKKDLPVRLWVAPPTKMDAAELTKEGFYNTFGQAGARTEMPGCSLCMGNQAQIKEGSTCISTSTRNFPNRLGKNTNVFLGSAELAAVASKLGKLPTVEEYLAETGVVTANADAIYKYMNFNQIEEYVETAASVKAC